MAKKTNSSQRKIPFRLIIILAALLAAFAFAARGVYSLFTPPPISFKEGDISAAQTCLEAADAENLKACRQLAGDQAEQLINNRKTLGKLEQRNLKGRANVTFNRQPAVQLTFESRFLLPGAKEPNTFWEEVTTVTDAAKKVTILHVNYHHPNWPELLWTGDTYTGPDETELYKQINQCIRSYDQNNRGYFEKMFGLYFGNNSFNQTSGVMHARRNTGAPMRRDRKGLIYRKGIPGNAAAELVTCRFTARFQKNGKSVTGEEIVMLRRDPSNPSKSGWEVYYYRAPQ